ncbi:MAG: methyltransferase domain-containing protein [Streptosporangiales bacterium]|nr:methyltransferase domain-containing protein [Streptosporangiales bacterium]
MNRFHRRYCASRKWAARVESTLLPWGLKNVDLGTDVLEVGPGLGVTTRVLAEQVPNLSALEIDEGFVERLRDQFADKVRVTHGDGAAMPFPEDSFSGVVCFTMLHHVPNPSLQDKLFAEACRVLRPGGVFAGTDSQPSLRFRLIHLFDTMTVVDPATLQHRLESAGFTEVKVTHVPGAVRFAARKPEPAAG